MNAKFNPEVPTSEEFVPTLGGLLYATGKPRLSEDEWVALVRATAVRDTGAFGNLFMLTREIVFTLMIRILRNRKLAEELTAEVFHEVWRNAASFNPADDTVIAWIMKLARARAVGRVQHGGGP